MAAVRRLLNRRECWALVALLALAALLRFATLDAKGFWEDEAETAFLVRRDLGDMLGQLRDAGATPPLYYLVARVWAEIFGTGEIGLRSLSALFGVAAVPVAYLAGRELVSRRAGLLAAALVATNPLLVWYGQDARSYTLLVLLSGLGFLFFARALADAGPRNLALWAVSSGLAIATHYFALFPFLAEAVWLLSASRRRARVLRPVGAVVVATGLLVPFAVGQANYLSRGTWIHGISLTSRIAEIPGVFLVGFETPAPFIAAGLAAALAAIGLWLLIARGTAAEKRGAWTAAAVGAAAVVLPIALSLAGVDYLLYRNVLAAALPLAVVLGAGLGAARAGRLGAGAAAGLLALSVAVVAATAWQPKYHRDDWRSAAHAIGAPSRDRVVVATPGAAGWEPLEYYLPGSRPLRRSGAAVSEVDLLALPRRRPGAIEDAHLPAVGRPPPPAPGMRLVERRRGEHYLLFRYRSEGPVRLHPAGLRARGLGADRPAMLIQPAR